MSAIEAYQIIEEHCGHPKLPRKAARAIRAILKERPDDPQVWLLAARCLRRSSPPWAYRCYQRAVRLRPEDLALAEEAGMFGLAAIGGRRDRKWSRFLVAARADPQRRDRIDALLRPYVRELIPAAAVSGLYWAAMAPTRRFGRDVDSGGSCVGRRARSTLWR